MLKIEEMKFGFNDAENYKKRENKEFFNDIFFKTDAVETLCHNNIYFLIGEKGTGKTAYAVYLTNNENDKNSANITYIRETDYQKFVTLKKDRQLNLSDYINIWKVIIYLLVADKISQKEIDFSKLKNIFKFQNLKNAIDDYYNHAFTPEIIYALNFIEQSKIAAELIAKYAKAGGEEVSTLSFTENRFQTNLLFIQKKFEEALRVFKIKKNHILFIDGIDTRPLSIPYDNYLECIKGLANAVWSINNDFFPTIRDSGRLRVVLVMRPDIFDSLGLQNRNNKIRDNSVLLDWKTTYEQYRNSPIFSLTDKLLASSQTELLEHGKAWDYYFPYKAPTMSSKKEKDDSFISFLRFSYYRPRDIITMLTILRENIILHRKSSEVFCSEDFDHPDFRRKYAEYLLGEVKDYLSFYYSYKDYELFLKYFEFLKGKVRFTYSEYLRAYRNFIDYLNVNSIDRPSFFDGPDIFLQFLYTSNVICFIEESEDGHSFIRWCFRERDFSNISPKVKNNERYEIHYGLSKALNLGKKIR